MKTPYSSLNKGNSTDTAFSYLEISHSGVLGTKSLIKIGDEQNSEIYTKVCGVLDNMIDSGSPPDLIVDLTNKETPIVRFISLSLGIPTVTTTSMEKESMT